MSSLCDFVPFNHIEVGGSFQFGLRRGSNFPDADCTLYFCPPREPIFTFGANISQLRFAFAHAKARKSEDVRLRNSDPHIFYDLELDGAGESVKIVLYRTRIARRRDIKEVVFDVKMSAAEFASLYEKINAKPIT